MNILEGAYDMHVHAGPDVVARKLDDIGLAETYKAAGLKGFVITGHYFNTTGRAYLINKMFPGMNAIGAVVLNNSMGGLNPYAVRQAGKYGTKLVYMPTMDAQNMWDYLARTGAPVPAGANSKSVKEVSPIRVYENGKLAEPIDEILDAIIDNDMILCSGHIAPEETLALFRRAHEKGVKKIFATHVEWGPTRASVELQKEYIKCGAYLEHNIANIMTGEYTIEDYVSEMRQVGAEHIILDTDLGQAANPVPVDMLKEYVQKLLDAGVTEEEIRYMIAKNPAALVG